MTYQEFSELIYKQVKEVLPEYLKAAEMVFSTTKGMNDTVFQTSQIKTDQDLLVPQFYMDAYFDDFQRGRSIEDIAQHMVNVYLSREEAPTSELSDKVVDYGQAKNNLILQLLSKDKNQELLQHVPHKDLEHTNLTAIMRVCLEKDEHGSSTVKVDDRLMQIWGLSIDTVYQDALANAIRQEKPNFYNIEHMVLGMMDLPIAPELKTQKMAVEPYEQYALTNSSGQWGASVLLYPDLLQQVAENSGMNLFVLPSSLHEVIVIADTGELNAEELQAMVISINHDVVSAEDVLSNEVYYYDKEEHSLTQATSREKTEELMKRIIDPELDETQDRENTWEFEQ